MPLQLGEQLALYLQSAVKGGVLKELSMVWRGSLAGFPYRAGEGVFQAQATLSELDFEFQPDWMALTAPYTVLQYDNESLDITADLATLGEVTATEVHAQLPDLMSSQRWLRIDAKVSGQATAARDVLNQSPLSSSVGAALEQVTPFGHITGAFHLSVPFFPQAEFHVQGEVHLAPQRVHIAAVQTDLENVAGVLTFNDTRIDFSPESATWHGIPVSLQVTGDTVADDYRVAAEVHGVWSAAVIAKAFPTVPLLQHFSGELASKADFELVLHKGEGFNYDGSMRTDFTAIASDLPVPFEKQLGEMWFWDTKVYGDDTRLFIQTGVKDTLMFNGQLTLGEERLQSALLRVGPVESMELPMHGMTLRFDTTELDLPPWFEHWANWQQQLSHLSSEVIANSPSLMRFLPPLEHVIGEVEKLDVWGQPFNSVRAELTYNGEYWAGEVNAEQTRLTLDYADYSDSLRVTADFLELQKFPTNEATIAPEQRGLPTNNWLDKLPPIDLVCRICRYDGKDLGRVTLGIDPREEGNQLRHLRILKSGTRLDLSGGWQIVDERLVSSLKGDFNTKNISALLQEWGADSVVRDSEVRVNANLNWSGNLLEYNLDSIDGEVQYAMGSGYLRDVSDGGARLLSVLSLESIVRKLTLDFRDIFARGMFYSSFTGSLLIEDGTVGTQDTEMIGSAGDLTVRGTTNLVTEQLDYQLSYTPKLTSSLPVLLAWMINPPSGLAALVIDRVLQDSKVISRLQYQVTGTMSEPVITEIQRDAKEVTLPESDLRKIQQTLDGEQEPSAKQEPSASKEEPSVPNQNPLIEQEGNHGSNR